MIDSKKYYLGIGIRNAGSALAGYGNQISDSGFDGKSLDVSAEDMLANLNKQVEKLKALIMEAANTLGK